ncbi:ComEC/Rec2 family competence protein [Chitinophaga ginsengisoli]|uniref:Beta-lactamase superfamily II metal-dependent hydrolase n=1 Tax=Chitinophaga ginsengisoli TaxID=363837 RepID=A0A2P8G4W9_9BACT|nr:hypothetical protein [Chitinophaga ginsengisoli]PSL29022.1 hypothetical protein CLV42_107168 [Chitinophaga ginsengisoli]
MCRKRKRTTSEQDPPARSGKRLKADLTTKGPLPATSPLPLSERITTLKSYLAQWKAELLFIGTLARGDNPFSPEYVIRTATTAITAVQTQLGMQLKLFDDELKREENRAAANIVPLGRGKQAGDGNLYVQFVNIGLGDCTLVTSPQGTRIMIDCGSDGGTDDIVLDPSLQGTAPFDHVRNQVKNKMFLNGRNKIDMLLLTHIDRDHHNKIEDILQPLSGISVDITYYGGTEDFNQYFTSGTYVKTISGDTPAYIKKAIIREEKANANTFTQSINDVPVTATSGQSKALGKEFIDSNNAMVLYYEENTIGQKNSDFKISLLAANVTGAWKKNTFYKNDAKLKTAGEKKGNGTIQNKRSLIILIECFNRKVLVCGDATVVAEYVAMNHYRKSLLSKVNYLRIGHHGSPTSSSRAFANSLKRRKMAIASVGGQSLEKHHLPQKTILENFFPFPVIKKPIPNTHTIYAWEDLVRENISNITDNIWATGSNDSYQLALKPPASTIDETSPAINPARLQQSEL